MRRGPVCRLPSACLHLNMFLKRACARVAFSYQNRKYFLKLSHNEDIDEVTWLMRPQGVGAETAPKTH